VGHLDAQRLTLLVVLDLQHPQVPGADRLKIDVQARQVPPVLSVSVVDVVGS
jgi:hypothetical protein